MKFYLECIVRKLGGYQFAPNNTHYVPDERYLVLVIEIFRRWQNTRNCVPSTIMTSSLWHNSQYLTFGAQETVAGHWTSQNNRLSNEHFLFRSFWPKVSSSHQPSFQVQVTSHAGRAMWFIWKIKKCSFILSFLDFLFLYILPQLYTLCLNIIHSYPRLTKWKWNAAENADLCELYLSRAIYISVGDVNYSLHVSVFWKKRHSIWFYMQQ